MQNLVAYVLTRNSKRFLYRCIGSILRIRGIEILVVDDNSTDNTRKVAESMGAKVIKRKLTAFDDQRNFALATIKESGKFMVFQVDSDEVVSKALASKINGIDEVHGCTMVNVRTINVVGTSPPMTFAHHYTYMPRRLFDLRWTRYERPLHEVLVKVPNCKVKANVLDWPDAPLFNFGYSEYTRRERQGKLRKYEQIEGKSCEEDTLLQLHETSGVALLPIEDEWSTEIEELSLVARKHR